MAELRPFHSILSLYCRTSNARWGNLKNVPGDDHPISFSRQLAVTPPAIEDGAHIASNVVAGTAREAGATIVIGTPPPADSHNHGVCEQTPMGMDRYTSMLWNKRDAGDSRLC